MTTTTLSDRLIAELKEEGKTTRTLLERVPPDQLTWAPHARSMTLGTLALHVAMIPGALAEFLDAPVREAPSFTPPQPSSHDEILAALDGSLAAAAARLASWSEEALDAEWRLTSGARTLITSPRYAMARALMLNHWYHHRGQLTVYLRLLGVPLPSVYGPTADESPFG